MTPEVAVNLKIISEWWQHPPSFNQFHKTLYTNISSDDPRMTLEVPVKIFSQWWLHSLNVKSVRPFILIWPRMTSDGPGSTSQRILFDWWLHPPCFKFIRPFILIWPQDDLTWPPKFNQLFGVFRCSHPPSTIIDHTTYGTWDIAFTRFFSGEMNKSCKLVT